MNHTLENQTLTLYFEGELNSFNADGVEKEIESILPRLDFSAIVLDMDQLSYISSAGLRIIVRLKQRCNDICIKNASPEVYEVFDMVGFNNVLRIEKRA